MGIVIQPNADAAAAMAARIFANLIISRPDAVLGLATGSTPVPLYRKLIAGGLDWSRITTFHLDEYIGIGPDHPQSYRAFMHENLFRHVNINPGNIHIPDGMACDPEAHCRAYEEKIHAAGGIDLQLLGIGTEGTSVSTSPHRRWPPARESKHSPPAPAVTTRFRLRSPSKPIYEAYIFETWRTPVFGNAFCHGTSGLVVMKDFTNCVEQIGSTRARLHLFHNRGDSVGN